ncbi:hypothetical protein V6N11_003852 [Hibiscus sabdariffa]|uniref:RNase H type-1 domain-containing protein n=1 Tax=Hibiscus sabdariffa TaxID=183260 RepID=A0ABR2SEG4_9ROSI
MDNGDGIYLKPYLNHVAAIKVLVNAGFLDSPRWLATANGLFRVNSAYCVHMGFQYGPVEPIWKVIASLKVILRVKTFIWRNECIFDPGCTRWEPILSHGRRLQQECQSAVGAGCRFGNDVALVRNRVRWMRPPEYWSKLNSYGAVRGALGLASCGGVIRPDQGCWIIGFSRGIGVCSVLDAKLWGIYKELLTVWSVGIQNLVIEVDSLDALRVIQQGLTGYQTYAMVSLIVELLNRS